MRLRASFELKAENYPFQRRNRPPRYWAFSAFGMDPRYGIGKIFVQFRFSEYAHSIPRQFPYKTSGDRDEKHPRRDAR
jgi:hypothetical protein